MEIVVVGDINADLIFGGLPSLPAYKELKHAKSMKLTLGGSSAIFACNIARLGAPTAFIGKVGRDFLGDFLIDTLKGKGVDTSRVVRESGCTGICVSMSFPEDYAMVSYPGIRESFHLKEVDLDYVKQARHLHVSGFYLQPGLQPGCLELFRSAKAAGLTTSLDPDHDPRETWNGAIQQVLRYVDFFLPNEVEATRISKVQELDAAVKALRNLGSTIVIKRGASGVLAVDDHTVITAPAFAIQPVDTTGAGDSFNAGFYLSTPPSRPLAEVHRLGRRMWCTLHTGAGRIGGISDVPRSREISRRTGG